MYPPLPFSRLPAKNVIFCPPIKFTGAAVSHVPAAFTLAVVVAEQPTPPCVTVTLAIDPFAFTAAVACAVQLPLNATGTLVPYGSHPRPCSLPTVTAVTAPPAAVTVSAGCTAFHVGITTAFRTVHPCRELPAAGPAPIPLAARPSPTNSPPSPPRYPARCSIPPPP